MKPWLQICIALLWGLIVPLLDNLAFLAAFLVVVLEGSCLVTITIFSWVSTSFFAFVGWLFCLAAWIGCLTSVESETRMLKVLSTCSATLLMAAEEARDLLRSLILRLALATEVELSLRSA